MMEVEEVTLESIDCIAHLLRRLVRAGPLLTKLRITRETYSFKGVNDLSRTSLAS